MPLPLTWLDRLRLRLQLAWHGFGVVAHRPTPAELEERKVTLTVVLPLVHRPGGGS